MIIREACRADILALEYNPTVLDPSNPLQWLEDSDGARAVEVNGKVVAVFGVDVIWKGVGHVWVAVDQASARNHALAIVKAGRRLVKEAVRLYGLHRVQTYVSALRPDIIRFNELIGLKAESVMFAGASDGSDIFVFAHVKGH